MLISKVSMYIVIIIVLCHSVRLIPTIWEISQTFLEADEAKVSGGFILIHLGKSLDTFLCFLISFDSSVTNLLKCKSRLTAGLAAIHKGKSLARVHTFVFLDPPANLFNETMRM